MKYVVADAITREELPGMPTPMLISLGSGEAYMKDEGIWRAQDDRYDAPGTEYRKVRVLRKDSYLVRVEVEPIDPSMEGSGDEPGPSVYEVRVEATSRDEARMLAPDLAIQRAQEDWDAPTFTAYVLSTEKEF